MKPIYQTVINVDYGNATCMIKSAKGNIYPADINRLNKTLNVGDEALVTKALDGSWIVIDVNHKHPAPLDVSEFPRDNHGDLNIIQHCKYLEVIDGMSESERVRLDNHLIKTFIDEYGMKNQLAHRRSQL